MDPKFGCLPLNFPKIKFELGYLRYVWIRDVIKIDLGIETDTLTSAFVVIILRSEEPELHRIIIIWLFK